MGAHFLGLAGSSGPSQSTMITFASGLSDLAGTPKSDPFSFVLSWPSEYASFDRLISDPGCGDVGAWVRAGGGGAGSVSNESGAGD